jgi:hypothetical protein
MEHLRLARTILLIRVEHLRPAGTILKKIEQSLFKFNLDLLKTLCERLRVLANETLAFHCKTLAF